MPIKIFLNARLFFQILLGIPMFWQIIFSDEVFKDRYAVKKKQTIKKTEVEKKSKNYVNDRTLAI